MSITLADAHEIARRYREERGATWFSREVTVRDGYWFFRVGYVGSVGIIVDARDGRLTVLGSALPLEDCFWGHDRGLTSERAILSILDVHDHDATVAFLYSVLQDGPRGRNPWPRRRWLEERLASLPRAFGPQSFFLAIPRLRAAASAPDFSWECRRVE